MSDCDSETYHTAEFIDYYLYPLSITHASYIKDTYDFVEKVKTLQIPPDAMLFTMDIDSLYTNIDIQEGIQVIKNTFYKNPNKKRPDKELLQLLEINLTRNDFEFNGEHFLQVKGTAMGKKFAPAYANIFMADWETSALAACEKKPLYYFRYLDDIWGVWTHSRKDFGTFLSTLNKHNKSIKLKSTTSFTSVDFLDTTTYKGHEFHNTQRLDVRVFFKETDTHALLFKTSFHPKPTYAGLVKSQLLRFHRICSHKSDFMSAMRTLFTALRQRGYSRSFLRQCYCTFQEVKPKGQDQLLPFITIYSPSTTLLVRAIKNNFQEILHNSDILPEHRIITAFRRNKNLQDYLITAKMKPVQNIKSRVRCDFFKQQQWVYSTDKNRIYQITHRGTTHTQNCIYLVICKTFQAQ